jgi:tetratricopeptide (TPR) repeat protein
MLNHPINEINSAKARPVTDDRQSQSFNPGPHPKKRGFRWLFVILIGLLTSGAGTWGYTSYRRAQFQKFEIEALAACKAATKAEDWGRLAQVAEAWLAANPQTVDGRLMLAEARSQQNQHREAADLLCQIPDDNPKVYAALLVASDVQLGPANQPLAGVETLKRLIRLRPDSITARQRLLYFYAVTHQREPLLAGIREAIEQRAEPPDVYVYLLLADHLGFTNGMPQLARWRESAPDDETLCVAVALQWTQAVQDSASPEAEEPNERKVREELLAKVTADYPKNAALFRYRCEAAMKAFEIEFLGTMLTAVPYPAENDSLVRRYRGWQASQTGDYPTAADELRKSLELFPLDWHTWQELSNVERRLGRLDVAEESARMALMGKELRKSVVQLPDTRSASPGLLKQIGEYAEQAGEPAVAEGIRWRLRQTLIPGGIRP